MCEDLNNFTVLYNVACGEVVKNFLRLAKGDEKARAPFLRELYTAGGDSDFSRYLSELILTDENAFSLACAKFGKATPFVKRAYIRDLREILSALDELDAKGGFEKGKLIPLFSSLSESAIYDLEKFYFENGYGKFINYAAFIFDGELSPVKNFVDVDIKSLKNYADEKLVIGRNIENFLGGLPYSHMLLYGDMGTGKSTTMHAMLTKYRDKGLRMIEIKKENAEKIPQIVELISDNPLKFILFLDDLSLSENDEKINELKAALEGSLSCNPKNAMIVATSNRRHIISENFSARENAVNPNEVMQEQLSLADRFGITVKFSPTDKDDYLSIVAQLADDLGVKCQKDRLFALAERWAVIKGGRSPRRAKQFVDLVYSSEVKGVEIVL